MAEEAVLNKELNCFNSSLDNKLQSSMENLDPQVRGRVELLQEFQTQHDELESKFYDERAAIEAKYQNLYQPLYSQRYEILNGIEGVPEFWLTAMKNNQVLSEEINDMDERALVSLKNIKCSRVEDEPNSKGFKLDFSFDTNPYFKNSVLTKTYHMVHEQKDQDEVILEKATGTEIEWYPGKCLTQKTRTYSKKINDGGKEVVTKTEDCDSFFNFFKPPKVPGEDEELDEDEAEKLQEKMEQDFDMGATIHDNIVPHAFSWFTGEAGIRVDEDEDDEEEEEEEENADEEEEEENADEDEEDEDGVGAGASTEEASWSKTEGASEVEKGERPPECYQQ